MNVGELRELLEGLDDDVEIRLAQQPSWPFEYSIARIEVVDLGDADEDEADGRADADDSDEQIVYIAEGSQLGYLPGAARDALDWR
jgi:hypothetical protein